MIANLIEHIFKDRRGYVSRKIVAAWTLTFIATFFFCFHFFWNIVSRTMYLEQLLSAEHWVSILTMVWGAYFASNALGAWIWQTQKGKDDDGNGKTENQNGSNGEAT